MRILQNFWHTVVILSQYNPPRFIELLMLLLAIVLLVIWGETDQWQYLALSLSYVVGASTSILIREALIPSPQPRLTQVTAVLLLIISFYGFTDLLRYL